MGSDISISKLTIYYQVLFVLQDSSANSQHSTSETTRLLHHSLKDAFPNADMVDTEEKDIGVVLHRVTEEEFGFDGVDSVSVNITLYCDVASSSRRCC